jgi:hypothetical protein
MIQALVQLAVLVAFGFVLFGAIRRHLFLRNGEWHFADGSRERRFVDGRWEYREIGGVSEGSNGRQGPSPARLRCARQATSPRQNGER